MIKSVLQMCVLMHNNYNMRHYHMKGRRLELLPQHFRIVSSTLPQLCLLEPPRSASTLWDTRHNYSPRIRLAFEFHEPQRPQSQP